MIDDRALRIRQQMREIRSELRDDATTIVENARRSVDWKHYVRQHPWVCIGAAAALGYFIVPRSAPRTSFDSGSVDQLAEKLKAMVTPTEPVKEQSKGFLVGTLMPFVLKAVLSGGMSFLQTTLSNRQHQHNGKSPVEEGVDELGRPMWPR